MGKKTKHTDPSWKNFRDYRRGKAKLQNAMLQHPDEDMETSVYNYMKKNVNKRFYIKPYSEFKKKKNK